MILGVDGRELEGKPTGVGMYLRNILERIQIPSSTSLQIYFKTEIPPNLESIQAEPVLLKSEDSNLLWQQRTLGPHLRDQRVRLLFSPANSTVWFFHGINVMTCMDLSYFRYPEWFSLKERASRRMNTYVSLRQADRIYVISNYVGKEIEKRFGVPSARIVLTSCGVPKKMLNPDHRQKLRKCYGHEDDKIILFVGSIFNRRHMPEIIEAMRELDSNVKLIVIGENRTYPPQDLRAQVEQLQLETRVKLLDYVSEKLLQDYFQMADLFVYLSDYEGFGIPALEAMSYGVPTVLSLNPAMDEIFKDAAYFVNQVSVSEVSRAFKHLLEDSTVRCDLARRGKELADRYTWEEAARVVSADWEQLLAARG
jgi:glycosyltransferase involved in cell wall biosynthesis